MTGFCMKSNAIVKWLNRKKNYFSDFRSLSPFLVLKDFLHYYNVFFKSEYPHGLSRYQ